MLKCWIEAMRLRTLPVSVAGVLMAWALAMADGTFLWLPAVICLVFAVLCQIASNFANEYYDYRAGRDSKGRSGPRRGVTEGDITPVAMKHATFALLGAAALLGLSLTLWGGLWLIAAGAFIGLGALAYSTGPYPLSTHCLGEVAVVFFFGIVPVNLTYYVQADTFTWQVFAASVAIGLLGANVLIVNNYRDREEDLAVGKHTLSNSTPAAFSAGIYLFNILAADALTLHLWHSPYWLVAPAVWLWLAIDVFYGIFIKKHSSPASLNPYLGKTAFLMLLLVVCYLAQNIF